MLSLVQRVLGGLLLAALCATSRGGEKLDFARDVRPILASHCFKCHGPDETARKAELRLDLRDSALKKAIVPGDPAKSELVRHIFTSDEDDLMPPPSTKHPLAESQKEILKRWVAEGAEYTAHWAFIAPHRPNLPEVRDATWARNGLDRFVLARLEREGLQPSPQADKHTLVRRVYLDLIGLPPTPEQVSAFVDDPSPNAYERLVDDLLASPHYGERWARRWLDLARYADTNGYEKDRPRSIWPYRDWVIRALNDDMPFDEFTIEQLAGDMLPNATLQQKIATGFHRNTMLNEEGGIDPLEYRFYSMVDRVHVTATTWLGLTMACAQCHTHKYDPIQHREYYQFMAFLNNADEPKLALPDPRTAARRLELESKIAKLEAALPEEFPPAQTIQWTTPVAADFSSEGGADGEMLVDGSFRVSGKSADKDNYTIQFESDSRAITHLMLEAIPGDNNGPGRTEHGNFVLSEIELEVKNGSEPRKIPFASAEADFTQKGFAPENTFDGKLDTGWAIDDEKGLRTHRRLILALKDRLELNGKSTFTVRLLQQHGGKHTLARFRLSLGLDLSPAGTLAERRKENFDARFAKWLKAEREKVVPWTKLQPLAAKSQTPVLTIESGGAIFASGDFTKNDTYKLKFSNVPPGTRAIRLEVLPDDRLPARGPGTVSYEGPEGDFFLSKIRARSGTNDLGFSSATESFAYEKNTAAKAIDDDLQSGWAINGAQGKPNNAVFQLAQPFAGGDLDLDLVFERYYAAALGKFRVWVSTEEDAKASGLSDPSYAQLIVDRDAGGTPELLRDFCRVAPELSKARREIDKLRNEIPKPETTLVLKERHFPRATFRHHRGEFLQAKEPVEPALPEFLLAPGEPQPRNRLEFARWLVSGRNPLTARVIMNRHWEAFFGRGLVRTLEDFGFQGELPSNPDLLDWLATEFVARRWSQKAMHKLIVMSATYRQSSAATPELLQRDPLNVLLARGPRFRLDAELVRDSALRASGLLTDRIGGPSVFPPQPNSVTTEGAYGALQWKTSDGADRYRRALYTFAKRTAPFAMNLTFDGSSGEACLARRDRSNTPLQALTLLNDEVFLECARAVGRWAAAQKQAPAETVSELFQRYVARPPSQSECGKIADFYESQLARLKAGDLKATEIMGKEASENEAAWALVARAVSNLDEAITKE